MPKFDLPHNDLYLAYMDESLHSLAIKIAHGLRAENIKCLNHLEPVKFKKAIAQAEKRGAQYLAIIGENEQENDTVQLKHLPSGKQIPVTISDLSSWVKAMTHDN